MGRVGERTEHLPAGAVASRRWKARRSHPLDTNTEMLASPIIPHFSDTHTHTHCTDAHLVHLLLLSVQLSPLQPAAQTKVDQNGTGNNTHDGARHQTRICAGPALVVRHHRLARGQRRVVRGAREARSQQVPSPRARERVRRRSLLCPRPDEHNGHDEQALHCWRGGGGGAARTDGAERVVERRSGKRVGGRGVQQEQSLR